MRVSVALHSAEPGENQRTNEAEYRDYNRTYADLEAVKGSENGVCKINVVFPKVGADPLPVEFFSIGVCEGPPDSGGTVIAWGSFGEKRTPEVGDEPALKVRVEVTSDRLAELGLKL